MAVQSPGAPNAKQFITYDMNETRSTGPSDATAHKAFAAGKRHAKPRQGLFDGGENAVYINVWAYEPGWTGSTVTENDPRPT